VSYLKHDELADNPQTTRVEKMPDGRTVIRRTRTRRVVKLVKRKK